MNQRANQRKQALIAEQEHITNVLLDKIAEIESKVIHFLRNILIVAVAGLVAYLVFNIFFEDEDEKTKTSELNGKPQNRPVIPSFVMRWLQENVAIFILELLKNKLLDYLNKNQQA